VLTQLAIGRALTVVLGMILVPLAHLALAQAQSCQGQCTYLKDDQVARAAYAAGFRGAALVSAIAIAKAESSFSLNAIHHNRTSVDYGLWQINTALHIDYRWNEQRLLSDADYNAYAAYVLWSSRTSWCPWVTFYDGSFQQFLPSARATARNVDVTVIRLRNEETGQVSASSDVIVRSAAGATSSLRTVRAGTVGIVVDGPTVATLGICPGTVNSATKAPYPYYFTWWKIHWNDGGQDGWSTEDQLSRRPGPPPAPTCTLLSSSATVISGQPVTLSWTSMNAATGAIDNGVGSISPVGSGSRGVSVSKTTTYTASFSGSGGSVRCSQTVTVITAPAPPAATTATNVSGTAFTANWNSSSGASGYRIDVSTVSSFANYSTIDVGNALSRAVTGLSANTNYYYRVRAYNAAGSSANSNIVSVKTSAAIPPPPSASAAIGITSSSFTASWSNANGATGYLLDVSTTSSFSSLALQNVDLGNRLSATVTGARSKTTYYYRVRAYNAGGPSSNSNIIAVTTK
jgi:hypothetical protein